MPQTSHRKWFSQARKPRSHRDPERDAAFEGLKTLKENGLLTQGDLEDVFVNHLNGMNDYVWDYPHITDHLAMFISRSVTSDLLSHMEKMGSRVFERSSKQTQPSKELGDCAVRTLVKLSEQTSQDVSAVRDQAKIDIERLYPSDCDIRSQLKRLSLGLEPDLNSLFEMLP